MANAGNPQMAQAPQTGQQPQFGTMGGPKYDANGNLTGNLGQAGPDYSKEQMGMGGAVPKGYYSGPLDGVHKYGEGPQAVQTQQFLDNNPDYLTGGTQAPQFIDSTLPMKPQPQGQAPINPTAMTDPTGVPKGSYIGPLGRVYKDGEGPQSMPQQPMTPPQGQAPQFIDSSFPMKPPQSQGVNRYPNPYDVPVSERTHNWDSRAYNADQVRRGIPQTRSQPMTPPQGQGMLNTLGQQIYQGIGGNIGGRSPLMGEGQPQQPPMDDQIIQARRMMEAQRVTPPQGQNIFEQSAGAYRGALDAAGQPIATGSIANTDLSQYTNPYEAQVVQNTMDDLERTRLMQQNQMSASASSAGAFGGSRQGIAEAETNLGFARQAANTAAQLRQAGYNQALTSAGQDVGYGLQQGQQRLQQGQQLGSLANLGLGMGQSVQNQQTQQGLQQQMMNQALIDAAKQQYAGYTGAPLGSLNAPLAAIGAGSVGQGTTTGGRQPGLYDYLALAASMAS